MDRHYDWPAGKRRTLRSRVAERRLGPSERMPVDVEQRVLLLHAEPRVLVLRRVHRLQAATAVVGRMRLELVVERLAHHQLVLAHTERVRVDGHRLQEHVRVGTRGLPGRRAVEVPQREV